MASSTSSSSRAQDSPLVKALAPVLPKDSRFTAWHLSTTPAITEALCFPPALNSTLEKRSSKSLKTYCEKHFLAVSVSDSTKTKEVVVLGLEIYIYTTVFSTTIFIAKADSTGYLHLQTIPHGFSPIRAITVAFIDFLIEHRRRPSKQLIINLFARAQSQYLFPGSVENRKKHVLDDRGLIKWWCRVLNPLLESNGQNKRTRNWDRIHGYLVIPGLDDYETRAFVPRTENATRNWTLGHPLRIISPYTKDPDTYGTVPPRCLIPTYPDDPKARFVDELEKSTSEKAKLLSGWKTPKTLDQFWEMMAFRQECSSGRMTGFVWVVFEPPQSSMSLRRRSNATCTASSSGMPYEANPPSTPKKSQKHTSSLATPTPSPLKSAYTSTKLPRRKRKKILRGIIIPREPRVKTHRVKFPDKIETPYYFWPEAGRGQVVLDDHGYKRAVELLLHLQFKGFEQAVASTARWINEVNMGDDWALPVVGEKIITTPQPIPSAPAAVNNLAGSMMRKRKSEDESAKENAAAPVNTLSAGLVRKKIKTDADDASSTTHGASTLPAEPKVNVLGAGLVRKKTKPT